MINSYVCDFTHSLHRAYVTKYLIIFQIILAPSRIFDSQKKGKILHNEPEQCKYFNGLKKKQHQSVQTCMVTE